MSAANQSEVPVVVSALGRVLRSFGLLRESPVAVVGSGIVLFWVLAAIFAPVIAPFSATEIVVPFATPGTVAPDGRVFWLGADGLGRDILSRVIWGSRTVLLYAPLATFAAYALGILMGVAAGYLRGWVDTVLSFVSNAILAFPVMVLYSGDGHPDGTLGDITVVDMASILDPLEEHEPVMAE